MTTTLSILFTPTVVILLLAIAWLYSNLIDHKQALIHSRQDAVDNKELRAQLKKAQDVIAQSTHSMEKSLQASMDNWTKVESQKIRAETLAKQKQVRNGLVSEHFAPFAIPQWNSQDYFRVGGTVDYLVLNGADAVRDRTEESIEIVLLDIKTGKAQLNTVQRRVRDAVIAGRVKFATYNMDTEELRIWDAPTLKNGTKSDTLQNTQIFPSETDLANKQSQESM
jgi:predicted Holliday junction resolvase-like endonuclease